jgi:hypothetical protein
MANASFGCTIPYIEETGGATLMMRESEETIHLPPGYRLDLVGDPYLIILRREDGTVVARFTHNVDPQEIRRAAEEDHRPQDADRRH